ncbi:hypothetical protein M407DRAFT_163850 [Tulasnella calospora MUT 4182]|uniref:Uncharacterized protein n=1 Tax=Tulasnella calospora MUT 4182 TaxID=1051891 RepID=A0A0C3L944_9AGAM|nr:hypothetical protein M407DRAFT_163850 [Tulasnella calospora MUT 4182]
MERCRRRWGSTGRILRWRRQREGERKWRRREGEGEKSKDGGNGEKNKVTHQEPMNNLPEVFLKVSLGFCAGFAREPAEEVWTTAEGEVGTG